jgi:hypothetical protein
LPRYFFHNHNGESQIDEVGIELPDEAAAKKEAIRATSEMLHDLNEAFGPSRDTKCVLWTRTAVRYAASSAEGHEAIGWDGALSEEFPCVINGPKNSACRSLKRVS